MDMRALVFTLRLNSLYSIRLPFTWMSALTFPLLPPSAVKGLLANALQRYKNDKHPLEYLKLVEDAVVWAGSRLISPCVVKSYIVSVITKWEVNYGMKTTNALGRQFAFTKEMDVAVILKNENLLEDLIEALMSSPVTCGDSESAAAIKKVFVKDVSVVEGNIVSTGFPILYNENISLLEGSGRIYPMHEKCLKSEDGLPLLNYIVPLVEERGILKPARITVKVKNEAVRVLSIEGVDNAVVLLR